jgi:membrane-bound lytic murein transglycosylase D
MRFFVAVVAIVFAALGSGCAVAPVQTGPSAAHQPGTETSSTNAEVSAPSATASPSATTTPSATTSRAAVVYPPLPIQALPSPDSKAIKDRLRAIPTIDLTAVPSDLWDRIRNGFAIPDISSPLVEEQQIWYASHPEYVKRMVERGKRYLYYIVEQLENRGMPTELALLPMVESAFNPMAYSRAHASGLWQFIPSTGKNYNLEQNSWYDGRRDIVASTSAALDYLQYLYQMYGDWDLALAAYNSGENAVARAIEKNKARRRPTDYLNLDLPRETRYYIPKLQALKNIIENPHAFGIDLAPVPNAPYFVTVHNTGDIDVRLAAKLADMPLREFLALNPGHNRPVIVARGTPGLVLPADKAEVFRTNLEERDEPLVTWQKYTFKRGDRLYRIAARHHISLLRLKEVNNIGRYTRVRPGYQLLLPLKGASLEPLPAMYRPPSARGPRWVGRTLRYKVRHGDTLSTIARRYGVSVNNLRRQNGIRNARDLRAGQHLTIEVRHRHHARRAQAARYKVRHGDTLSTIALRYKVSVEDLRRQNNIRHGRDLRAGQQLTIEVAD